MPNLFLPAAAQRSIELNKGEQLVTLGLSQAQFSIKQVAVSIQGIEERIDSTLVS
jgi:hypothetical protein